MNKKAANAIMRAKYGASWFERAGAKTERSALMSGRAAPARKTRPSSSKPRMAAKRSSSTWSGDAWGAGARKGKLEIVARGKGENYWVTLAKLDKGYHTIEQRKVWTARGADQIAEDWMETF